MKEIKEKNSRLMIVRYVQGAWIIDEDSTHHFENLGDLVELQVIRVSPVGPSKDEPDIDTPFDHFP